MTQTTSKSASGVLQETRQRLQKDIVRLEQGGLGLSLRESTGELSAYDNHPADIGDELFERSKDLALRDNARLLLQQVEEAEQRIAAGTYGTCTLCGRTIAAERLQAIPWADTCMACQRELEQRQTAVRPLEEQAPLGRDNEDLDDAVEYGSADSPQDRK